LFDVLGKEIKTLVNEIKQPGTSEIEFEGTDLSSGVYLYKIEVVDFVMIRRMVLIK